MKRDPSIHITLSRFENILESLEVSNFPTGELFKLARRYSIDSRAIIASNKQVNKQVNKITLASHGDANLVAEIIYATRIKLKQRGVRKINQSNIREWSLCKTLADICNRFCEEFGLDTRLGFITYIELGISKLDNNRNIPNRLVSMYDSISSTYESTSYIKEYTAKYSIRLEVENIHNYYVKYIANSTGILEKYYDNPEKYIHFCKLHKIISENGFDYKDFIDAQFEALSFCNGIPGIENMYGEKALERFNKYLYKNNKNFDTPVIAGGIWNKIK